MKYLVIILLVLSILVAGCTIENVNRNEINKQTNQHNTYDLSAFPIESLSAEEINALNLTLNDEYKAEAIYQKVIAKFGEVKPFSNIILAEQKHSGELIKIYERYNLAVPENDWYDKVPEFETVEDACIAGIDAEIENAKLYDDLILSVDNEDILFVFKSLRDASINNHLPAFQKCSQN